MISLFPFRNCLTKQNGPYTALFVGLLFFFFPLPSIITLQNRMVHTRRCLYDIWSNFCLRCMNLFFFLSIFLFQLILYRRWFAADEFYSVCVFSFHIACIYFCHWVGRYSLAMIGCLVSGGRDVLSAWVKCRWNLYASKSIFFLNLGSIWKFWQTVSGVFCLDYFFFSHFSLPSYHLLL